MVQNPKTGEVPRTRLQEIYGLLNAYRQGWISYDREHVLKLQRERRELEQAAAAQNS